MKRIVFGLTAIVLAGLTSACGYSEHTYAVQAPAPAYERPVSVPGATYYGDRAYDRAYDGTYVYRRY